MPFVSVVIPTYNQVRYLQQAMAGAVIDGMTRDADGLVSLGFPTFSRGVTARNFHYPEEGEHGAVNVPVVCGGVVVEAGDLIIGDGDGVVVVPRTVADAIADDVVDNLAIEQAQRAAMTRFEPFGVADELRSRGYRFEQGDAP